MLLNPIKWDSFNGAKFQEFCNALLLFTVGKWSKVYSKQGADGGIDQIFNGSYGGKTGTWRFQDKFHLGKEKDVTYLKKVLVKDIRDNFNGEDNIIYLTNCDLLPQQEEKLILFCQKEIAQKTDKPIFIAIWHHAQIDSLLKQSPFVYYWYWQPSHIALEKYQDAFQDQLNPQLKNLPAQLTNGFWGREKDLDRLKEFLQQNEKCTLPVVGEGLLGKTRLCVEFFKRYVDKESNYIPLVLTDIGFLNTNLAHLLNGNMNFLILVDDAWGNKQGLQWVHHFAGKSAGRIKVLFTTRPSRYDETIEFIPTLEKTKLGDAVVLKPLSGLLMYELLKPILGRLFKDDLVKRITKVSGGNPGVSLALCQEVLEGRGFHEIAKQEYFNERVKRIVNEAADDISKNAGIVREGIIKTIHSLAALGPMLHNDDNLASLAWLSSIDLIDLKVVIEKLQERGLVPYHGKLCIKPDPYSESIFSNVASSPSQIKSWNLRPITPSMRANLLKNLAIADTLAGTGTGHSDNLLYDFISQIKGYEFDYFALRNILECIKEISFLKPNVAAFAVKGLTYLYADLEQPTSSSGKTDATKWPETDDLKRLLGDLIQNAFISLNQSGGNEFEERLEILLTYARAIKSPDIIAKCFYFKMYDLDPNTYGFIKGFVRQEAILPKLKEWVLGDEELCRAAAFKIITHFLELDHHDDGNFDSITSSMVIYNWKTPNNEFFKALRRVALEAMIEFIKAHTEKSEFRKQAITNVLRTLFFMGADQRHKDNIDQSDELQMVKDFILPVLLKRGDTEINLAVRWHLRIFERKEIKDEYKSMYTKLLLLTGDSKDTKDALQLLVHDMLDPGGAEFIQKVETWLEMHNSPDTIFSDLISVRAETEDGWFAHFTWIVDFIAKQMPERAKAWFTGITLNFPEYVDQFIGILTANFRDEVYFYGQIDKLWKVENKKYWSLVMWALTIGRRADKSRYQLRDFRYMEEALQSKHTGSVGFLHDSLPDYILVDKQKAFEMMATVSDTFPRSQYASVFLSLLRHHKEIVPSCKEEIKELIFHHSNNQRLTDFNFKDALYFLDNEYGFDILFEYVKNRIKVYQDSGEHYSMINSSDRYFNPIVPVDKRIDNYFKVLSWYVAESDSKHAMTHYLMFFFRPKEGFTKYFCDKFKGYINSAGLSKNAWERISVALEQVHDKSTEFVNLIVWLAEKYVAENGIPEKNALFPMFFSAIVYGGGVKRGTPGKPFPEDERRRDTLYGIYFIE